MTELDPQKVSAILQDYSENLEVLTINSKPLINDLTMAADRYKHLAGQIIEKIESRLFEVSTAFFFSFHLFLYAYLLGSCTYCERTANEAVNRDTFLLTVEFSHVCVLIEALVPVYTVMNQKKMKMFKKKRVVGGMSVPSCVPFIRFM